jgi:hypothetical protein
VTPVICRSCRARIFWARTTTGKMMPIDPVQDENGLITLTREEGQVAPLATVHGKDKPPPDSVPRYTSHFATCPAAGKHRKAS